MRLKSAFSHKAACAAVAAVLSATMLAGCWGTPNGSTGTVNGSTGSGYGYGTGTGTTINGNSGTGTGTTVNGNSGNGSGTNTGAKATATPSANQSTTKPTATPTAAPAKSQSVVWTYENNSDGTITITGYDKNKGVEPSGTVTIPSQIDGKTVSKIGDKAFQGNSTIVNLTVPGTVKSIGAYAFAEDSALESVTLSSGTEIIYHHALWNCINFKVFRGTSTVTSIGDNAFGGCNSLNNVSGLSGSVSIGSGNDCLTKLTGEITDVERIAYNQSKTKAWFDSHDKTEYTIAYYATTATSAGSANVEYVYAQKGSGSSRGVYNYIWSASGGYSISYMDYGAKTLYSYYRDALNINVSFKTRKNVAYTSSADSLATWNLNNESSLYVTSGYEGSYYFETVAKAGYGNLITYYYTDSSGQTLKMVKKLSGTMAGEILYDITYYDTFMMQKSVNDLISGCKANS